MSGRHPINAAPFKILAADVGEEHLEPARTIGVSPGLNVSWTSVADDQRELGVREGLGNGGIGRARRRGGSGGGDGAGRADSVAVGPWL